MAYIDTKHIGQCETCRHYDEKLNMCEGGMFFCDSGENYSPNMFKIPTADVVEVVRCVECKYIQIMSDGKTLACIRQSAYRKPTDFCSYGKKRSDT